MLFNSIEFLLVFLPIVVCVFHLLEKQERHIHSKVWLTLASLFFYSWWNISYLPIILGSCIANFYLGIQVKKSQKPKRFRQLLLGTGISLNVAVLGYFKYSDFLIQNMNSVFGRDWQLLHLTLPLAISFFTFQQIAYLVDNYKQSAEDSHFFNYLLFVTFFPQLIAGPIVHHKEMMPQFEKRKNQKLNYKNISVGSSMIAIGLVKKVVVADSLAIWVNKGFARPETLTFIESWLTSFGYTLQLYFDFSGYTDMAIGAALLFNIKLPINFNSPYKARNIQDFWRRWHMTLSRFLRDYIYIPLGGNRTGTTATYRNLFLTFLIGGFWHGANWTFVFWGALHGLAIIWLHLWKQSRINVHPLIATFLCFNFVNLTWIFFRSDSFTSAGTLIKNMVTLSNIHLPAALAQPLESLNTYGVQFGDTFATIETSLLTPFLVVALIIATLTLPNSQEIFLSKALFKNQYTHRWFNNWRWRPTTLWASIIAACFVISLLCIVSAKETVFLYFQF